MKLVHALAVLAVAGSTAAPAGAQVPTSTEDIIPSSSGPGRSEIQQSDAVFRDLIACVIRYQPGRTRNLLDTIPGTHDEANILYSFQSRMETCFNASRVGGRALFFPTPVLRGAIAEAYYRQEFPNGATAPAPAEAATGWAQPRRSDDEVTQAEMIHSMARCVTVRQPAGVKAVLDAPPLSPQELAAIRAIQADLSACLDSNVSFNASRQAVRALLAEAALHYGEAQRNGWDRVGRGRSGRD